MASKSDTDQAEKYGVSPAVIAAIRKQFLIAGEHYIQEGRSLSYTAAGESEIATRLGAPQKNREKKEGGDGQATEGNPSIVTVTVVRRFPNPTWILVRDGDGTEFNVRVRNNASIGVGQEITAKKEGADWTFAEKPNRRTPLV
jgi:hypothetical protein